MIRNLLLYCFCVGLGISVAHAFQNTTALTQDSTLQDSTNNDFIIIRNIQFTGNKKTREVILRRELDIAEGDTLYYDNVSPTLLREKNKIFNTDLFVTVDATIQKDSLNPALYDVLFTLKERWYIFPVFVFELSDRNFNEWWHDRGADLNRTNYGVRFVKKNVRGRNEKLEALIQLGFTQKYEFFYTFPYLDKKQLYGLEYKISYSQNKSIAYKTESNKLIFTQTDDILRERFYTAFRFRRRDGFYKFHFLELRYNQNWVADTIPRLNPAYFLEGKNQQKYFNLGYEFSYDRRDVTYYPLNGNRFRFKIDKFGILPTEDVNMLTTSLEYTLFKPLSKKFFVESSVFGRLLFQKEQPYFLAQGLGYGDSFIRSYQFYVIDGQHYFISKSALKFELFNIRKTLSFIPIQEFQTIPIAVYPRVYFDFGYIQDNIFGATKNQLANQWLYGTGVGLDIVSFYNLVLQFDYGINAQRETGFFFNISGAF